MYSETRLVVRYAETDRMGVVHHSNYLIWFEAGRTDLIRKMGMSYSMIEEMGVMLPVIELKCNYRGASRYEDEIVVRTRVKGVSFSRITFFYEVFRNGETEPITTGETTHAWTSKDLKPVNIRKYMPEMYNLLSTAVSQH